ncbi:SixA phosphatase family protein [Histidinibacterium lentulum]|uniref:Histidine phosphatase family protein n=1 Tax=Histidinibacterium lentulum TaxID=2480588 RepID=A0A3N2R5J8_9RHOB|nr:histidine phosphatase family protein [Histidinibacterium lentulum]ROU02616.1 histidine phosphatase family protein [Histidinibacterium lentulum]
MPRLILIRHAKSAWDDAAAEDHARVLNERGRRAAPALGDWLARRALVPGQALVSDAARTRETWALIAARLEGAPEAEVLPALYHASAEGMLQVLRDRGRAHAVAMVGHNPGIGEFAARLVAVRPDHPQFAIYPTGATTVIDLPARSWEKVGFGTGGVVDFVVPRELADERSR